jgi:hypothetical protein
MSAFGVVDGLGGGKCDLTIKVFDREDPVWAGNELTRCDVGTLREMVKKLAGQFVERLHGTRASVGQQDSNLIRPEKRENGSGSDREETFVIGNFMWQRYSAPTKMEWRDAKQYCENLSLGGYGDWKLPNITELRTLIQGCPKTEPSGDCTVTHQCRSYDCREDSCDGCAWDLGPADDCYWLSNLQGRCDEWYWSSSTRTDRGGITWSANFRSGRVGALVKSYSFYTRCVRPVRHEQEGG